MGNYDMISLKRIRFLCLWQAVNWTLKASKFRDTMESISTCKKWMVPTSFSSHDVNMKVQLPLSNSHFLVVKVSFSRQMFILVCNKLPKVHTLMIGWTRKLTSERFFRKIKQTFWNLIMVNKNKSILQSLYCN